MATTILLDEKKTIIFDNIRYVLNQAEDIWEWFGESKVGEYTHFYSKLVFHKEEGFYAAYKDNLTNGAYV